jgi:hypothetical protein
MLRVISGQNRTASAQRAIVLAPFYYLDNFHRVIECLDGRYRKLLSLEERQFIVRFGELPQASRALLVRMVMRQGIFFRRSGLNYHEIGDTTTAAAPLIQLGWVDENPSMNVGQLQRLLTKPELMQYFSLARPHRRCRKTDIIAFLGARYPTPQPFAAWCRQSLECVYKLIVAPLCDRFRLMFFGNFKQSWTEFVLTDLGVFSYEKIPACLQSPAFFTRAHIDSFEQLYRCQQNLDAGLALDAVLEGIPPPIANCDWLEDCRQKVLFQVGRTYEQRGDANSALAVLSSCTYRGARTRTIRLLQRARDWKSARNLCITILQNPNNNAECQQTRRFLPRLNRKLGVVDDKPYPSIDVPVFEILLDTPNDGCAVEYAVRDRLLQESAVNTSVHYVENGLITSLFGLLCWKALFAPIPGAFFHDFQYAPADLSSDRFYRRREREFAACFAQLATEEYQITIKRHFTEKYALQCPFVAWGLLSERLLELAFACFPAAHLRLWFEWIVRDSRENRSGFPDLVQFWPAERLYRLIEVKGPRDRLQDNQRRLFEYCLLHKMPVSVCQVRWSRSDSTAEPHRRAASD